jgi:hypothetical protein
MNMQRIDELLRWEDDGGACAYSSESVPALTANPPGSVYYSLAAHQVCEEWDCNALVAWLQAWAERLIVEFKLQVSRFALSVDWLSRNRYGHFRRGHNGFGLQGQIAINRNYLNREGWEILGTLLHELLHAEQEEHGEPGKNNYHNAAFRRRAAEFGLIIDERGFTQYAAASKFAAFLAEYGVDMPDIERPTVRMRNGSKLKLWMCPCKVRVRVAISDFQASCLRCGGVFALSDNIGSNNGHRARNAAAHVHTDSSEEV